MLRKTLLLVPTHGIVGLAGFGPGIYLLQILTAPEMPSAAQAAAAAQGAVYRGEFRRDLKDSDPLHWGEGRVSVGPRRLTLEGRVAPGPDYKLYLSPEFVETEADFQRLKATMRRIGDVKTFENFVIELPEGTDVGAYTTVIVWCETVSQFITAARYR